MEETAKSHATTRPVRGGVIRQFALLALAVMLLVQITGPLKNESAVGRGGRILVADLADTAGDVALNSGLRGFLNLALGQSPHIAVYPDSGVRSLLRQMRLEAGASLTPDLALQLCRQANIPAFLAVRMDRQDGACLMSARLFEIRGGGVREFPVDSVRARDQIELTFAAAEIAGKTRIMLGESERSLEATGKMLPPPAAENAEALSLFIRALSLDAKQNHEGEISILQQAVILNPRFALAHLRLAELLVQAGMSDSAIPCIAKAAELADTLPLKERLRALGISSALNQEFDSARSRFRELEVLFPGDPAVQVRLADLALQERDFKRAVQHLENALRLEDSGIETYLGLALALLYDRNSGSARKAWEKAGSMEPADPRIIALGGCIDLADNDLGSALRSFRKLADDSSSGARSLGLSLVAQALIYGGRFRASLDALQEGIELDKSRGDPDSEMDKRLSRAQVYIIMGNRPGAAAECRMVPAAAKRRESLKRMGIVLAQAGQTSEAQQVLERIRELPATARTRYDAALLAGEIQLVLGRPDEAIVTLRQARDLRPGRPPLEPLARALFQGKRLAEAEEEYRMICERKAEYLFPRGEAWFTGTWTEALFENGRCLTAMGKTGEAMQAFRSYLWVLDGADPGLPKVREAREYLKQGTRRSSAR